MPEQIADHIVNVITKAYGDECFIAAGYGAGEQLRAEIVAALKEADRRAREDAAGICDAMLAANDKAHGASSRTWGSGIMSGRSAGFRDAALAIRASITTDEG